MTNEVPDGPWTLGQGECDGKPMLMRINTGAAPFAADARYCQRLSVAIPHRAPNADGFPRPDEAFEIGEIEDQLVAALTAGGAGAFVLAITSAGITELVFYLAEAAAAVARVETLTRTLSTHQLRHDVEHDPEWDVFLEFVEATDAA